MATLTLRGLAGVAGVGGTISFATVAIYPVQQTLELEQKWEEETIKDVNGFDACWVGRNEHQICTIGLKMTADTAAHAAAPLSSGGTGVTALSALGQPFTTPYGAMVLASFTLPAFNGTYQIMPGSKISAGNTKIADGTYILRRYADSTQAAASVSVPS
jgi:hypothetical protein